jgi:hypothetical protein
MGKFWPVRFHEGYIVQFTPFKPENRITACDETLYATASTAVCAVGGSGC